MRVGQGWEADSSGSLGERELEGPSGGALQTERLRAIGPGSALTRDTRASSTRPPDVSAETWRHYARWLGHELRTPTSAAWLFLERARLRLDRVRGVLDGLPQGVLLRADLNALEASLGGALQEMNALREVLEMRCAVDWQAASVVHGGGLEMGQIGEKRGE